MKFHYLVILSVLAVIFVTACTQQQPVYEITIPGHGSQIYSFGQDVRQSLQIPISNELPIMQKIYSAKTINFVFDGSTEDTPLFQIVLFNTVERFQTFFAYEGKFLGADNFQGYYFIENQWYNKTNHEIEEPVFANDGVVLWLRGPNTGAKTNQVQLDGNIIYVDGIDRKNIEMSADRLTLAVFGINSVE